MNSMVSFKQSAGPRSHPHHLYKVSLAITALEQASSGAKPVDAGKRQKFAPTQQNNSVAEIRRAGEVMHRSLHMPPPHGAALKPTPAKIAAGCEPQSARGQARSARKQHDKASRPTAAEAKQSRQLDNQKLRASRLEVARNHPVKGWQKLEIADRRAIQNAVEAFSKPPEILLETPPKAELMRSESHERFEALLQLELLTPESHESFEVPLEDLPEDDRSDDEYDLEEHNAAPDYPEVFEEELPDVEEWIARNKQARAEEFDKIYRDLTTPTKPIILEEEDLYFSKPRSY
jgi:hypothetical protein